MRSIRMKIKWWRAEQKTRRKLKNQAWSGMRGNELSSDSTDIR